MAFDAETIGPWLSPAYSQNIYEWAKKNQVPWLTAFRSSDGPYVGYEDCGGWFVARAGAIVRWGAKEIGLFRKEARGLVRDDALWAEYLRIGVCALFPDHEDYPERWVEVDSMRTCKWCGRVEHLRRWEEVVTCERWEVVTVPPVDLWPHPDRSGEPTDVCGGTGVARERREDDP